MEIVFATNNKNKIKEVNALIGDKYKIRGLEEIGCNEDIPETEPTIEGNALQKAKYVSDKYGVNCFADDTGLEVVALDGRPGVFSARYAGEGKLANDNMNKVLLEMKDAANRIARFKTVIALIIAGNEHLFEGVVKGEIIKEKRGEGGLGYDPIFKPEGFEKTFAEMDLAEKNLISHRAIATMKLVRFFDSMK